VEVVIALAIMVMASGIAIPALSNIGRAELRKTARILGGGIRRSYNEAILTGRLHRLVFDLEAGVARLEQTEARLQIEPGSNLLATSMKAADDSTSGLDFAGALDDSVLGSLSEALNESASGGGRADALTGLLGFSTLGGSGGGSAFSDTGVRFPFAEGVRVLDIWQEGFSRPQTEGELSLLFFPHGYTQQTLIHLENDSGEVFSIRVSALTGQTELKDGYLERDD